MSDQPELPSDQAAEPPTPRPDDSDCDVSDLLATLDQRPVQDHVAVYHQIVDRLQTALASASR